MNIITTGTYDLIHPGHINFLSRSSSYGRLIVALNSDDFVERHKGKLPIMCYEERERILSAIRFVSEVVTRDLEDIRHLILSNRARALVIGKEWSDDGFMATRCLPFDWLEENKVELICVSTDMDGRLSSTDTRNRVIERGA